MAQSHTGSAPPPSAHGPGPAHAESGAGAGAEARAGAASGAGGRGAPAPPPPPLDPDGVYIKPFDWGLLKADSTILFLGRRHSGKSKLLLYLILMLRAAVAPRAIVGITPNQDVAEDMACFMPPSMVYQAVAGELVKKFTDLVSRMLEAGRRVRAAEDEHNRMVARHGGVPKPRRCTMLIADDCMYDKKVLKSDPVKDMFMNGRHANVSFINLMQRGMGMDIDVRGQLDFMFLFQEPSPQERASVYNNFPTGVDTFADFEFLMREFTSNFEVLVLHCSSKSPVLSERVYYTRADLSIIPPAWRAGHASMWKLHYRYAKRQERLGAAFVAEAAAAMRARERAMREEALHAAVAYEAGEEGDAAADAALPPPANVPTRAMQSGPLFTSTKVGPVYRYVPPTYDADRDTVVGLDPDGEREGPPPASLAAPQPGHAQQPGAAAPTRGGRGRSRAPSSQRGGARRRRQDGGATGAAAAAGRGAVVAAGGAAGPPHQRRDPHELVMRLEPSVFQ